MNPTFNIDGRKVGLDFPPLVIAELGINHNGSIDDAINLADAAIASGAEIIKHQTHIPDEEMSLEAKHIKPGNDSRSIYDVISETALTLDEERTLANYVRSKGVIYISTPFSKAAADFLQSMDVPAFKIGSGECNNYPLVKYIAGFGKPIIVSTGMNTIDQVAPSVRIMRDAKVPFALLHCTNLYPTPNRLLRLNSLSELQIAFPDAVVGLSDHSTTIFPCVAAVALGASILERHFTDTRDRLGPDISCSMIPSELTDLIEASSVLFQARGGGKTIVPEEDVTRNFAFSSIVSLRDLAPGTVITQADIGLKRPSGGDFSPQDFELMVGKSVAEFIPKNTQIKKSQVRG